MYHISCEWHMSGKKSERELNEFILHHEIQKDLGIVHCISGSAPDSKGDECVVVLRISWIAFYRLARTSCRIFFEPNSVIFWHILTCGEPGIFIRCFSTFFETAPNPPITTGITIQLHPHIFCSSALRGPYFDIFSVSFRTLVSHGHDTSITYTLLWIVQHNVYFTL